ASSMRAGHSFLQALDTVSKEVGDPSGPEFARVVTEIRLGRTPDDALTALADRVGTEEFKWAMMAVNVQREVGGNLAELLLALAGTFGAIVMVGLAVTAVQANRRRALELLQAHVPQMTDVRQIELAKPFGERAVQPFMGTLGDVAKRVTPIGMRERIARQLVLGGSP